MKMFFSRGRSHLMPIAAVVLSISLIAAPVAFADSAQLVIYRSPNFGNIQWLRIWIDGVEVEAVGYGHDFHTSLSPGRHVIAVLQSRPTWHYPPVTRVLKASAGQTYEFTAVWGQNDRVFLQNDR
jgi:hypothetical protein